MEHLNNIGYNKIERIQTSEISQVHLADPYLNSNDINKIAKNNLGDSFTFVFNKGNTKTISLVNNNKDIIFNEVNNNQLDNDNINILELKPTLLEPTLLEPTLLEPILLEPILLEPTQRQQKIISILDKQTLEHTPSDSGKLFYKMLDNKLNIEDYKGLQKIILNTNITTTYKDTYIKVIDIFISMLVKEKTKGEKLYKDKDISQLVINLTS